MSQRATVSVVVPTYNRCSLCVRAVESALQQDVPPDEVLVCDDGSRDGTRARFERWASEEPRLTYLRLPSNTGTPAGARNLGVERASSDWVAFLDDDDRWLPTKLTAQTPFLLDGRHDLVAGNAVRASGGAYFPHAAAREVRRADLVRDNPIIISSAVVRRPLVLDVGGFSTQTRIAGIEDYELWLRLADAGARFLVLPELVLEYDDHADGRLSDAALRVQSEIARVAFLRWRDRPADWPLAVGSLLHGQRVLKLALRRLVA